MIDCHDDSAKSVLSTLILIEHIFAKVGEDAVQIMGRSRKREECLAVVKAGKSRRATGRGLLLEDYQ